MAEHPKTTAAREQKARAPQRGKRQRLTQQAIVAKAAELFAERGFGATSLDDIAEKLGVGKARIASRKIWLSADSHPPNATGDGPLYPVQISLFSRGETTSSAVRSNTWTDLN